MIKILKIMKYEFFFLLKTSFFPSNLFNLKFCFFLASNIESNVNGDDKHGTLERGASGADTLSREV